MNQKRSIRPQFMNLLPILVNHAYMNSSSGSSTGNSIQKMIELISRFPCAQNLIRTSQFSTQQLQHSMRQVTQVGLEACVVKSSGPHHPGATRNHAVTAFLSNTMQKPWECKALMSFVFLRLCRSLLMGFTTLLHLFNGSPMFVKSQISLQVCGWCKLSSRQMGPP